MHIYPYSSASKSAKALAEALGVKRLKREGGLFETDTLINWGCSAIKRDVRYDNILNHPAGVAKAANKLETFKCLDGGVGIPEYTTARLEAEKWLAEGSIVFSRTILNGNSGKGIIVSDGKEDDGLPDAPLYTKYVDKVDEYRVHVFRDKVIHLQKKARRKDVEYDEKKLLIRNHDNGFVFMFKGVRLDERSTNNAIRAVALLGLDFGAVDLILDAAGNPYVLEVNTACGLEGTTLERYVEAFRDAD